MEFKLWLGIMFVVVIISIYIISVKKMWIIISAKEKHMLYIASKLYNLENKEKLKIFLKNEEESEMLEELKSFEELENFSEIKATFESFSENKKFFANFLENKEEFKSFLEIKDKLKDFLEVKAELKSLLEKRDKLKKRWDKISIDLKEEKLRVNGKILLLEKSNSDYVYSTMIGFISILIVFVTFGYSQWRKDIVSPVSDDKFVAIYLSCITLMALVVLFKLRFDNQKSICELNYYKIYLEAIEEIEKELADKKAEKKC